MSYANYTDFTLVYSLKGVSEADITSAWLPYGTLRVNEELGGAFTTPFSSNNLTAKDLSIHFAALGVLLRTRNQTDSEELKNDLMRRVMNINSGNMPMMTNSGVAIYPDRTTKAQVWSSTQDFKPVFDMRNPLDQRVDPDLIDALNDADF